MFDQLRGLHGDGQIRGQGPAARIGGPGQGEASAAQSLAVFISLLCVFASVVNMFVAYGKLCWFYRCPKCRARARRVPEARAGEKIRYLCARCQVEWDTGWHVADGDWTG